MKDSRLGLFLCSVLLGVDLLAGVDSIASGQTSRTQSSTPLVGYDVENPQWLNAAQQSAMVVALKAAHVGAIRFPLAPLSGSDFSSILSFTEEAFRNGIRSDVIVSLSFKPDVPLRPAVTGTLAIWPMPHLSAADPDLFGRTYKPVFDRLDRGGVILAGIELGNEINWPQYNGDFPVPGTGRTLSLHDLETDPLGKTVASGFRAYIATLSVLKHIRDSSIHNKATPILLAGLAEISPISPMPSTKVDDVDIATTIDFMRANGADVLVDRYAVHTYSADGLASDDAAARSRLEDYLERYVLRRCGAKRDEKPCWITEWGATQPSSSCPFAEGALPMKVRTFLDTIMPMVADGRVSGLFYADWGDPVQRGLFRCGKLSVSGRLYQNFFRADRRFTRKAAGR